jgi:hypothetical protein
MDRPERPDKPNSESIFSKPDPTGDPTTPRPEPDQPQTTLDPLDVSTWGPPARSAPETSPPVPGKPRVKPADDNRFSPRMLVGLGSAGAIALVLIGFIAFSVFGGEDDPVVAGGDASPTPTASSSAEPTTAATPEPTASAEPTPKPTPAGPPVELAMGDWATVTVGELQVRAGAGANEASTYRLVRGAVMTVSEGPQVVNGANWYRIASLGGVTGWVTSGWVADPYLETILNDPVLIRCGEVANPVFDMVDGAPVAREVVRVGDFAVPSNKLDVSTLAAIELARGIRAEVCVTAQVGSNGLPALRSEPRANACGHAVADGQAFWLRPAADQEADVSAQIKDPALVHPILLAGPAENRQSSNLRSLLTMMSHEGAAGCVQASINIDSGEVHSQRGVTIEQCSIVTEYNDLNLKLHPATGGPMAWIKLPQDGSSRDEIPLERPIEVYISSEVYPDGISSYAWSSFNYEREECA